MRNRLGLVLCILIGSFSVYCGQVVMTGVGHGPHDGGAGGLGPIGDGPVGDAMAQSSGGGTCCSTPARETPTVIFDDMVAPSPGSSTSCSQSSPVWDVSGYRSIVVHSPNCNFTVQARNGKAGFVAAADAACDNVGAASGLSRVLTLDTIVGHELRVAFGSGQTAANPDGTVDCKAAAIPLTVVGFKSP